MTETITWIDVRERLPNPEDQILIFAGHERLIAIGFRDDDGFYSDDGIIDPDDNVTHWAHLPTGPQPASQGRGGEDTK